MIVGAIVTAAALVSGTWALAAVFQSPAQREALALPPPPQPVFAAVKMETLADQRSYPGVVANNTEETYTLTPAADAVRTVVTGRPPVVSEAVRTGDLLTEVNTRPVFIVSSPFDFFRDVGFGDEGADVRVLQEALVSQNYIDHADGKYGFRTGEAVARWYRDAGYQAPMRQRLVPNTSPPSSGTTNTAQDAQNSQAPVGEAPPPDLVSDPYVPFGEMLAVRSLPATIITAPQLGAHVSAEGSADLTLGSSELIVRVEVPVEEAAGLSLGAPVVVTSESGEVDASIALVETQTPDEDGTPRPSLLTVMLGLDPKSLSVGRGDTVTVQVRNAIVAEKSLVVPTAAVVGRGTGRGVVVKRLADGSLVEVPVDVTGSLRGMTAVVPDGEEALVEGDEVRVG